MDQHWTEPLGGGKFSASEVTTLWRYTYLFSIIIIIFIIISYTSFYCQIPFLLPNKVSKHWKEEKLCTYTKSSVKYRLTSVLHRGLLRPSSVNGLASSNKAHDCSECCQQDTEMPCHLSEIYCGHSRLWNSFSQPKFQMPTHIAANSM